MISHVHHINFIVHDLNQAVARYKQLLGFDRFVFDSLDKRGVKTARVKLGDTWLVLVQPVNDKSIPAQHLKEFGEGFFLISFATDDLEAQLERFEGEFKVDPARSGLNNWSVTDLPKQAFFGTQIQLTQELINDYL